MRISASRLWQLSDFVSARMGLHFPADRVSDLKRGITGAAREFGFGEDVEACIAWLFSAHLTQPQIEILASHLTVGETYFFREKKAFEILEREILPELIAARRERGKRLRIWSAGCSSGEEPFSIAITLHRLLPDLHDWHITILGTDINPHALHKAHEGVYGEWSFRSPPPWLSDHYFTKIAEHRFKIAPQVRKLVTFAYLNLAEDVYPALLNNTNAMDLIFCRNVLMYFPPERAARVLEKFHGALVDGGWFIGSATENFRASEFEPVSFSGITCYRKGAEKERPREKTEAPKWTPLVFNNQAPIPLHRPAAPVLPTAPVPPPKPPAELARACANEGRLDEALALCDEAIAADKLNAAHYYLRATILQEQDSQASLGAAETSLKRALYLDHNFVLAHFALGNLALQQGREREAQKYFENAFQLLRAYPPDDVLAESEGMTAGRLAEIIQSMTAQNTR